MQSTAAKVAAGPCVIILHGRGQVNGFLRPPKKGNVPLLLPPSPGTKQHPPLARPRRRPFRQHAAKRAAAYLASFSPFAWPPLLCTNQAKKPARGSRTSERSEEIWSEYPESPRWSLPNKAKYRARGPRFELAPTKLRTTPGVPAYSSAARICGVGFRPANGAGALSLFRPRIISREARPATGRPARERAGGARSGRRRRRC